MSRGKVLFVAAQACLMLVFLVLASCSNGNLFGKLNKDGDSGTPEALIADAESAYRDGDFTTALSLYERVLASNPNNSEALYGASAAALRSSGINIATLVSNITTQSSSIGVSDLASFISQSRESITPSAAASNSLLNGVSLAALSTVIDQAICRLHQIVAGAADGTISSDDVDVLLNLGSICLLRAILRPLEDGLLDVVNNNGDFEISVVDSGDLDSACQGSLPGFSQAQAEGIVKDVASAYVFFNQAADKLGLTSGNPIILQLRSDINDVYTELLTSGSVPVSCRTLLSTTVPSLNSFEPTFDPSAC